jgi:hypothetical protein
LKSRSTQSSKDDAEEDEALVTVGAMSGLLRYMEAGLAWSMLLLSMLVLLP